MKSRRPYLIRALYDWIVDSNATPFILVKVNSPAVVVPRDYVTDGQITLNIAPSAVRDLLIGDDVMSFAGRFSGQSVQVSVPLESVGAVYARETGDGMLFDTEPESESDRTDGDHAADTHRGSDEGAGARTTTLESVAGVSVDLDGDGAGAGNTASPRAQRNASRGERSAPHLRVVK